MRTSPQALVGTVLATLVGFSSALGARSSPRVRDLQLAVHLGLDPDLPITNYKKFRTVVANLNSADAVEQYAEIPVDHNDPNGQKYQNRYWVNDADYQPGGPVFVLDVGEADASRSGSYYLTNETSFLKQYMEEFHAVGIVWEHRYYGKSTPFPVNLDTPAEHFQYLTNEQALADLPYFAKNFSRPKFEGDDLTPDSTPWIIVGGSYSGMRSAFSRSAYPDTFFAAMASSAPVQARIDMRVYYEQVYRGMVAYGYGDCVKNLQAATAYIDQQLGKNSTAATLKQRFLGKGAENNSNGDFTAALTAIYGSWQSSGVDGGQTGIAELCGWMEGSPQTNGSAPSKAMAERLADWPQFVTLANDFAQTNCKGLDSSHPAACELGNRYADQSSISWTWQYCSEWGYYQANNEGSNALLSTYQTLDYYQLVCDRQFPDGISSGYMPKEPQTEVVNNQTGGWSMRPSNVYWSGGQFDPWRTLSPLSTEPFAPQGVEFSTDIPECGVQTGEQKLFGYTMSNAEHCFDFYTDFPPGATSREYFKAALKKWLPCFKPKDDDLELLAYLKNAEGLGDLKGLEDESDD